MAQCEGAKDKKIPKGTFWMEQQIAALKTVFVSTTPDKIETKHCGYFFFQQLIGNWA